MITLFDLTEFLGWASLLNMAFLLLMTILIVSMKSMIITLHSKMFAIPEKELSTLYFTYLGNYKMMTLVFIVVPYFALKIMGY